MRLSAAFAVALPLAEARAAFVPTDDARGRLSALLAREDVQAELRRLGVDPAEAAARVEALSDAEVAELESLSAQASGQDSAALGILLGILAGFFFIPAAFLTIAYLVHLWEYHLWGESE